MLLSLICKYSLTTSAMLISQTISTTDVIFKGGSLAAKEGNGLSVIKFACLNLCDVTGSNFSVPVGSYPEPFLERGWGTVSLLTPTLKLKTIHFICLCVCMSVYLRACVCVCVCLCFATSLSAFIFSCSSFFIVFLSLSPQALKALQDMSLSSPCSPPPLSMRHSKAIPVQAFEVYIDIPPHARKLTFYL